MSLAGNRLRALAVRILDQRTMERVVDPFLADLELEYTDAIHHGRLWMSRWILILGHFAFLKTIAMCQTGVGMRVSQAWTLEDREALSRALKFSAVAGMVATFALAVPPFTNPHVGVFHPRMFVYVVPQAVVLAVPIGFTLGVFLGLGGRTFSSRIDRGGVGVCNLLLVCVPGDTSLDRSTGQPGVSPGSLWADPRRDARDEKLQ